MLPTVTGSGESALLRTRSASGPGTAFTVVPVEELLLVTSGSDTPLVTLAVLSRVPAAVGVMTIVIVALPPLLIVPRAHVTVLVPLQLPWLVEEETKVTPPGNVSVTTTPVAASGPLFVTMIV